MSLCIIHPHVLQPYASYNVRIYLHILLTSGVDGGEWPQVKLSKGRCTCREKSLESHQIVGWMGTSGGLGVLEKREMTFPRRESNHFRPPSNL
jgi:hypothetical protein